MPVLLATIAIAMIVSFALNIADMYRMIGLTRQVITKRIYVLAAFVQLFFILGTFILWVN